VSVSSFKGDYHPGGSSDTFVRRTRARKAGLASGAARRRRSTTKKKPRARSGQSALALNYKQPGITRRLFERAYELEHPFPDLAPDVAGYQWLRGRDTAWTIVKSLERWWRVKGQHFTFTNGQLLATMDRLGLELGRRQLQRVRGLLGRLGYGVGLHVRRGGAEPGNRDFLRFERRWTGRVYGRSMYVTPPSGAGACPLRGKQAPACTSTSTALIPRSSIADDVGHRCAAPGIEEEQAETGTESPIESETERRFVFLSIALEHAPALLSRSDRQELERLRRRLGGSGQDTALTDSIACEGER
jgi:hypothetical protein